MDSKDLIEKENQNTNSNENKPSPFICSAKLGTQQTENIFFQKNSFRAKRVSMCQKDKVLAKRKINQTIKLFQFLFLDESDSQVDMSCLGHQDLLLINKYLDRKFRHCDQSIQVLRLDPPELRRVQKTINELVSKKRFEENVKFVYKGVVKRMKNKFYQGNSLKHTKISSRLFYEHYFESHASESS